MRYISAPFQRLVISSRGLKTASQIRALTVQTEGLHKQFCNSVFGKQSLFKHLSRPCIHSRPRQAEPYVSSLLQSRQPHNSTCQTKWRNKFYSPFRQHSSSSFSLCADLHLSEEVREGLHAGRPLVALESTIITHGMPYPENVRTAVMVEQVVRDNGAIPATVGVLRGQICVGMSNDNIEWLGSQSTGLMKISRRDIPVAVAQGLSGGTTVSGTMIAAHKAGIAIFATGGIGGVHRGVEDTMDVSADLRELGRTPVAVVSAGVKSILDIGRTLEYLETEGVCVVTYGCSADFPAFFTRSSGYSAPYSVQTPETAASIIDTCLRLELNSGMLFAVPIPEEFAASGEVIEAAIQEALRAARATGITGKDVTPFVLQRVNELTQGKSLAANVALVKNNASLASQIAVALTSRRNSDHKEQTTSSTSVQVPSHAQRIVKPTKLTEPGLPKQRKPSGLRK